MNNDFDKQQFDKIAKLETDVAVIKEGIKHIMNAVRRLEKKTDENCKMLRDDNDTYRQKMEERIEIMEKSISTINVRIAKWAGAISVLIFLIQLFGEKLIDLLAWT